MKNRIKLVVLALLAPIMFAACSKQRPEANEWGCTLGSGPFDNKSLKGEFGPGAEGVWTNDRFVTIPSDIRFYLVDSDPATADFGARPIVVPAKGSSDSGVGVVQVSVETQVRFMFNERACEWYVKHGRRSEPLNYAAKNNEESGWNTFLNASMNQKLIESARPVVANEDYITLYVNGPIGDGDDLAYEVLAKELSTNLSRELVKDLGGEYFCGPSYVFDGNIDGELDNGCPPLEVTIKRIAPVDNTLIERLEKIVANEEQQRTIESDKQLTLEQIAADQEKAKAQAAADADIQTAQQQSRQEIETAKAQADLAIQQAREDVLLQQLKNDALSAEAQASFCRELAEVGVDCALLAAAEAGNYPRIIMGDDANTSILVSPNE